MKALLLLVIIGVMLITIVGPSVVSAADDAVPVGEVPWYCLVAKFNPGYAAMCMAWYVFEYWNPLDW